MTTLIYNHITARVPGTEDQFLINEYGEEVSGTKTSEVTVRPNLVRMIDMGDNMGTLEARRRRSP